MNESKQANVSVIIPCYRCVETVERAVQSVVQQTMIPAEIILVDDASDDREATSKSLKMLYQRFGETETDIPIRVLTLQKNEGPSGARNTAWNAATSDFIAFLDADDAWHPNKLEIQYAWMQTHPEIAISGHHCCQVDVSFSSSEAVFNGSATSCYFRSMLFRNPLMTRSVMMRRDIPLRFSSGKRYAEDYLLWLQAMASGLQVSVLDAELAYSFKPDYGEGGLAGNLWRMECGEMDNFRRLYRAGKLSGIMYLAVSSFSFLKYFRRIIISSLPK